MDESQKAYPSPLVAWYAVGVLLLAYTISFVDRIILSLMVAPIQRDLQISDTQISLLHGFAFAIFYTLLGLPLARAADRSSRRRIIMIGILVWSVMTAACGLARNFVQLFIARVGVGVGEAALSPAAYSMIGDLFPPNRLGRAISIYTTGITLGAGLALILGSMVVAVAGTGMVEVPWLGAVQAWQLIFFLVGLPGIAVAFIMLTVPEPVRRDMATTPASTSMADVFRAVARTPAIWGHFAGFALASLVFNGFLAWAPTLFVRKFGLSPADAGFPLGFAMLVGGTMGMIAGGVLADRWAARGRSDAAMRAGLVACIGLIPTAALVPLLPTAGLTLAGFWLFFFFVSMPFGVAPAALQKVTPPGLKAQMIALYLFVINLAGIGAGPTAVALITDYGFADKASVGSAMAIVGGIAAPLAALALALSLNGFRNASMQYQEAAAT